MWIEELHNSKGTRYKYCERFKLSNGKWHKVAITLNSKSPYAKKQATIELQNKIEKALHPSPLCTSALFVDVANDWLEHKALTVKLTTVKSKQVYLKKMMQEFPASIQLQDVTPVMIEDSIHRLYHIEGLTYEYVKAYLQTIKTIYKYAKRKRIINDIADILEISLVRKPITHEEIEKKRNKFLDADELKNVLTQLKAVNERIGLAMEFISRTGLRCGELLAIRECDINHEEKTVSINGTILQCLSTRFKSVRGTPKNIYSVREIVLDERCMQILNHFIIENKRMYMWYKGYEDNGYIFTTKRGNPYNIPFINRVLKKTHIEGKTISTHIFRHTHISILAELNIPLKAIMQRVGHNDPATTLSIYTHVTEQMQSAVRTKLNALSI